MSREMHQTPGKSGKGGPEAGQCVKKELGSNVKAEFKEETGDPAGEDDGKEEADAMGNSESDSDIFRDKYKRESLSAVKPKAAKCTPGDAPTKAVTIGAADAAEAAKPVPGKAPEEELQVAEAPAPSPWGQISSTAEGYLQSLEEDLLPALPENLSAPLGYTIFIMWPHTNFIQTPSPLPRRDAEHFLAILVQEEILSLCLALECFDPQGVKLLHVSCLTVVHAHPTGRPQELLGEEAMASFRRLTIRGKRVFETWPKALAAAYGGRAEACLLNAL